MTGLDLLTFLLSSESFLSTAWEHNFILSTCPYLCGGQSSISAACRANDGSETFHSDEEDLEPWWQFDQRGPVTIKEPHQQPYKRPRSFLPIIIFHVHKSMMCIAFKLLSNLIKVGNGGYILTVFPCVPCKHCSH
jgi:hypothetical protein